MFIDFTGRSTCGIASTLICRMQDGMPLHRLSQALRDTGQQMQEHSKLGQCGWKVAVYYSHRGPSQAWKAAMVVVSNTAQLGEDYDGTGEDVEYSRRLPLVLGLRRRCGNVGIVYDHSFGH